ncbi:MAG: hypothetical protein ACE361_04260 [Aureliella sp.]
MCQSLIAMLFSFTNPVLAMAPSGPSTSWSAESIRQQAAERKPRVISSFPSRRIVEQVELIELNHFYDDLGRHAYDQVVFYEWSPDYRRLHVLAWHLVEKDAARIPRYDPGRKDYYSQWVDRDEQVQRTVRSNSFQETWSQTDPERDNRRVFDEKYRVSFLPAKNRSR